MSHSDLKKIHVNPWKTLRSRQVYRNQWISVYHEHVINPSGGDGIYGVVHFKNLAVGILPVDEEGYTYLVGQYRYPLQEYSFEIPEGGCPKNEEPLACAKRELREETGFEANKWEPLLTMTTSNSVSDERGIVFLAKGLQKVAEPTPDETEDLILKKISLSEAIKWALEGKIKDSLSLAALLKYAIIN